MYYILYTLHKILNTLPALHSRSLFICFVHSAVCLFSRTPEAFSPLPLLPLVITGLSPRPTSLFPFSALVLLLWTHTGGVIFVSV